LEPIGRPGRAAGKRMKVLIILSPVVARNLCPVGIAYLKSFLTAKRDVEVLVWNLSNEIPVPNDEAGGYWMQRDNMLQFYNQHQEKFGEWTDRIMACDPDIIGFSVWASAKWASLFLAGMVKERDKSKVIVFGGPDCSIDGEDYIRQPHVDAVVRGEGEMALLDILDQVRATGKVGPLPGVLVRDGERVIDGGWRPEIANLDELPFPDYSGNPNLKDDIPLALGRGCMWRCRFCNSHIHMRRPRRRSARNIYNEIRHQKERFPKICHFSYGDPNGIQDLGMLSELCDLLSVEDLHIHISLWSSLRPRPDLALLKKMKRAGFGSISFGVQTASPRIKKAQGLAYYSVEDAERLIRDCFSAGIEATLNFIVGFPGETWDDFQQTMDFIKRNKGYIHSIPFIHTFVVLHKSWVERFPRKHGLDTDDPAVALQWRHPEAAAMAGKAYELIKGWGIRIEPPAGRD